MRLRYAGQLPVTFTVLGLEVLPGDEFEIDDERTAGVLLRRADVEEVPPAPVRRAKAVKQAAPADSSAGDGPAPVTEEVDHGVSERR